MVERLRVLALAVTLQFVSCTDPPPWPLDPVPPPRTSDATSTTDAVMTFAVTRMFLGDTDAFTDVPDDEAWKSFGYNLDGKSTTAASTDVCVSSSKLGIIPDGADGRDDSFAAGLLPLIDALTVPICYPCPADGGAPALSTDLNDRIGEGEFTLQIQTRGWSFARGQGASGLEAQVFTSDQFGDGSPSFDATTDWPVQPESLVDATSIAAGAKAHFTAAYVTNGTFVAGTNESVTVPIHVILRGSSVTILVHRAVMALSPSFDGARVIGTIAGLLDAQELTAVVRQQVSAGFCDPKVFDNVANDIASTQDILNDGTNHAGAACNAISFAVDFEAKPVANPTKIAAPAPIPADLCDAGAD